MSSKHSFVNIDQSNQDEPPPNMEIIQISKIEDKFPGSDENPGLKEMFYKRSNEPFFLIKFWVNALLILQTMYILDHFSISFKNELNISLF